MIGENGFLKTIRLKNFLSFGEDSEEIELKSLNVLIGANASGKSNLIEALRLLRAAPQKGRENDIENMLSKGGGVSEWIWKGESKDRIAEIQVHTDSDPRMNLIIQYNLKFHETSNKRFEILEESLIRKTKISDNPEGNIADYYYFIGGHPELLTTRWDQKSTLKAISSYSAPEIISTDDFNLNKSIFPQRYDNERFPNVSYLADEFFKIKIYQDWDLSIASPIRAYQDTNILPDFLKEDASNLALILNYLLEKADTSKLIYDSLRKFSLSFEEIIPSIRGGEIQYRIRERGLSDSISMKRLSEGYVRFLCLLAILCHPEPPSVICIEEPEQCMHPDIIPVIAELLIEASHRTQLFVTTHSDHLVSALTDVPESVIVCDRMISGTHLKRLEKEPLKKWLKEYTLGDLWCRGELGGVT
jgi:predicted ATPase